MLSSKIRKSALSGIPAWRQSKMCLPIIPAPCSNVRWRFFNSSNEKNRYDEKQNKKSAALVLSAVGAAWCVLGSALYWRLGRYKVQATNNDLDHTGPEPGEYQKGMMKFTREKISSHRSRAQGGTWASYKQAVYDLDAISPEHNAGMRIYAAAGGPLEFWFDKYKIHKIPGLLEIAEKTRIGNLDIKGSLPFKESMSKTDPYYNDPDRGYYLYPRSRKPYNSEPNPGMVVESFITPTDMFFVRNHAPVPVVNINKYRLKLVGARTSTVYKFCELTDNFPKKTTTVTLACASSRRDEMMLVKPINKDITFGAGMIGTATFGGVVLSDILRDAGIDIATTQKKHLVFEAYDKGPDGRPYGISLPIELVRDMKNEILLAYEMNGEPLTRDHGYPLRLIVPGVAGVRSVKWLKTMYMSDCESDSYFQRCDYKGFHSSIDLNNVDFMTAQPIWKMPVISAICDPPHQTIIPNGVKQMMIRGYAWSGGGMGIIRVDVSPDGGDTWLDATLYPPKGQTPYSSWAWTLWEVMIPIPQDEPEEEVAATEGEGKEAAPVQVVEEKAADEEEEKPPLEIICKAVDISSNVQPDSVNGIWNFRGVLNNAWHRILLQYFIPHHEEKAEDIEEVSVAAAKKSKKIAECDKCQRYMDNIADIEKLRAYKDDEDDADFESHPHSGKEETHQSADHDNEEE